MAVLSGGDESCGQAWRYALVRQDERLHPAVDWLPVGHSAEPNRLRDFPAYPARMDVDLYAKTHPEHGNRMAGSSRGMGLRQSAKPV